MKGHRNLTLVGGISVLLFFMISAACSFSVPSSEGRSFAPTLPFGDNNTIATATAVRETDLPGPAETTPPQTGANTPQIPETGEDMAGSLAEPVTDPPANLEELYERSNPGVVSIIVRVNQGGQVGAGAGSGFILTDKGYIVTNHHVIDGADTIIVRFYNSADIQAQVVGDDPNSDLAIIQVERMAEGAKPLPLGDSGQVAVGDSVVAIGNPYSLGTSMSSGIVSAVGRTIPSGFTPYNIPQAIQTDAAINPGNSGGPLINMRGEVIGINAQIRVSEEGGGNTGIGFAIPINILKLIYPNLLQEGSYRWPYLGVSSPSENALSLSATDVEAQRGALIAQVESGGPSAEAGIREGDVVIQADDQKITSFDDLLGYIAYKKPGDTIQLTIVRDGQQSQVAVTLGQRPGNSDTTEQ
jgi:2-alkenal reductase